MQYAAVHFCVCSISICTFGLFTRIAVCKFLRGLAVVWPETFLFVHCLCLYTLYFSCIFCMAHCALDFARGHMP